MEGTFREETVYAVVFWLGLSVGDRRTLAAFLPVDYGNILVINFWDK